MSHKVLRTIALLQLLGGVQYLSNKEFGGQDVGDDSIEYCSQSVA
jgi:hypothetical protein